MVLAPVPATIYWHDKKYIPWQLDTRQVTEKDLEKDFTRFGKIKGIEKRGTTHAYVLYEDMDSAKDACNKMRGTTLSGHRIR